MIDLLRDWAHIVDHTGDRQGAAAYAQRRAALVEAVNTHAWDGEWFRRATRDDGRWLGSRECDAGSIYLNPQIWAIMSDGTTPDRAAAAWGSAKQHLFTAYGPLLLTPAYTRPDASIGYITRYPPGSRENGGVYTHAATWALAAACKRREPETVASIWRSLSPILRAGRDPDAYAAEPYVLPGNSDGPLAPVPGRAGWTWYTGSAAWLNRISLEWVLGVRPTWDGLLIDPCPAPDMGEVEVVRRWRGTAVRVRFDAAEFSPRVAPSVAVNGRPLGTNTIRGGDIQGESEIEVAVSWGREPLEPVTRTQTGRTAV
jgi:cellobiose phosphorylase